MDTENKVTWLGEMILCCHKLYLTTYNEEMELIYSNCPEEEIFTNLLLLGDTRSRLEEYVQTHTHPVILSNELGLMWLAAAEQTTSGLHVHVFGPFFFDDLAIDAVEKKFRSLGVSVMHLRSIMAFLKELPVISMNRMLEYAIMLQYTINGEHIDVSQVHYRLTNQAPLRGDEIDPKQDVHGTYQMERELCRMVRDGDLNFMKQVNRLSLTGRIGKLSNGEPTRQMKNAVLVCIVLFSRAAIEGGLSPEIALTLTDQYFQSVEAAHSLTELTDLTYTMQNDFVRRVHRIRGTSHSKPIMECCDYIDLHLEDDISLKAIAASLQYSPYYLGRKFKEEMGVGINEYVRTKKLALAKDLLMDSTISVKDVSDRLGFCSHSYFSESFKNVYGFTPTEWRDRREELT
ncbi:MAG: helix-turn-helix domain-containing protein [Lachnospiraceae bacterium]|nr:helix-turn-helix domain-containing protein [Lachnospiraceae bacterium]